MRRSQTLSEHRSYQDGGAEKELVVNGSLGTSQCILGADESSIEMTYKRGIVGELYRKVSNLAYNGPDLRTSQASARMTVLPVVEA